MVVYKITNIINKKTYVGQTRRSLSQRWSEHLHSTNHGSTTAIHNAIRKYGKSNFTIDIIASCTSQTILNRYESVLIEKHNTLAPNGYNIQLGGDNHSMDMGTKMKLSRALGGKSILARNLKTNKILNFKSQGECKKCLGLGNGVVSQCLQGKYHTAKGYTFALASSSKLPLTKSEVLMIKKKAQCRKNVSRGIHRKCRVIVVRNLKTNVLSFFNGQTECAKELKLNSRDISKCLNNHRYQTKGYSFLYKGYGVPLTQQEINSKKSKSIVKLT